MISFIKKLYTYFIKPCFFVIFGGVLIIIGIPLLSLLSTILYLLYLATIKFNKYQIKKKLYPIIKETSEIYNVNILQKERIIFTKKNVFASELIPDTLKNISKIAESFKEKAGSIDCSEFLSNRDKFTALTRLKTKKNNIFFSPLYTDAQLQNEIHLYDLTSLDEYEIRSILKMDLSDTQKFIIHKRYYEN